MVPQSVIVIGIQLTKFESTLKFSLLKDFLIIQVNILAVMK